MVDKLRENNKGVVGIIILLIVALVLIIFFFTNAKYKSSFSSSISLKSSSQPGNGNIIAFPFECQTQPDGQTAHFPKNVSNMHAGDICYVNPQSYRLEFYHSSAERQAGTPYYTFGPVFDGYQCDDAGNDYPLKYASLNNRWVKNINYTFDEYSRRGCYSTNCTFSEEKQEWVINPEYTQEIAPGVEFTINSDNCYFIAYFSSHWCADDLTENPESPQIVELSTIKTFGPRFNTKEDAEINTDPLKIYAQSGTRGGQVGDKLNIVANYNSSTSSGLPEKVNDWSYKHHIEFSSENPASVGEGGGRIGIDNSEGKYIRRLGIVVRCPYASSSNRALLKVNSSADQTTTYASTYEIETNQIKLGCFNFKGGAQYQGHWGSDVTGIDIFLNGEGASHAEVYAVYVDGSLRYHLPDIEDPEDFPDEWPPPRRDGLDVAHIEGDDMEDVILNSLNSTNENLTSYSGMANNGFAINYDRIRKERLIIQASIILNKWGARYG